MPLPCAQPRLCTRRAVLPVLIALFLVGLTATTASADTYYVDKDSRGGSCSDAYTLASARNNPAKPFCTVDALAPIVPSGAEVLIRGGSYPGWAIVGAHKTAYVTLKPYGGETVTTRGVHLENTTYWTIEGIEITGYDKSADLWQTGRFSIDNSSFLTLERNAVRDALAGIYVRSGNDEHITFSHNTVEHVRCPDNCPSEGSGYGIEFVNGVIKHWRIEHNVFRDLDGDGWQAECTEDCRYAYNLVDEAVAREGNTDHADGLQLAFGAVDFEYIGNVVINSAKAVCFCSDHETPWDWHDITFADNVFYNDHNYCLSTAPTKNLVIRNNICWNNQYEGLRLKEEPSAYPYEGVRIYNNIFGPCDSCGGQSVDREANGVVSWHNNMILQNSEGRTFDPSDLVSPSAGEAAGLFVDAAAGDFRPAPGSIAIDAGAIGPGDPVSAVDADGMPRQVGPIDVGPYEYQREGAEAPGESPGEEPPGGSPAPAALQTRSTASRFEANAPLNAGRSAFGLLRVDRRRRSLLLLVNVPGPGRLIVRGRGIRRWAIHVGGNRIVSVPVRPRGRIRRRLKRTGRASVLVVIRFRPAEGRQLAIRRPVRLLRRRTPVRRRSRHGHRHRVGR